MTQEPATIFNFREICYSASERHIHDIANLIPSARTVGFHRDPAFQPLLTDRVLGDVSAIRATIGLKRLKLLGQSQWLKRELKMGSRPAVVLCHSVYEAWEIRHITHHQRLRVAVMLHGSDITTPPELVARDHYTLRQVNRHWSSFLDDVALFLPVSKYVAGLAVARGIPERSIRLTYLGVQLPDNIPERQPTPARLLFAGRLAEGKGLEDLLRACVLVKRQLPNLALDVAGSGPLEGQWRALSEELRLTDTVNFLGWQTPTGIDKLIDAAACVVVPSNPRQGGAQEALGLMSLEAQARNCPVVVSDGGGLPETIPPGSTNVVFAAGSPKKLSECLLAQLVRRKSPETMALSDHVRQHFDRTVLYRTLGRDLNALAQGIYAPTVCRT